MRFRDRRSTWEQQREFPGFFLEQVEGGLYEKKNRSGG